MPSWYLRKLLYIVTQTPSFRRSRDLDKSNKQHFEYSAKGGGFAREREREKERGREKKRKRKRERERERGEKERGEKERERRVELLVFF